MDPFVVGLCALSYLAGGIPTGYLLARSLKGIDIREHGSGNPGAANVYRVVGRGAGAATLAADALKGFFPVLLARRWYPDSYWVMVLCGALAIVGHVWTVFLKFRGGKGVATSAGVFAALLPKPLAGAVAVFILGVAATGHISVGSMGAALVFPFLAIFLHSPAVLSAMAFCVSGLVLIKHVPNFKRLVYGSELSFRHGSHLENGKEKQ